MGASIEITKGKTSSFGETSAGISFNSEKKVRGRRARIIRIRAKRRK